MNRVGFVSLGCAKALVDSERIITQLRTEGYDVGDGDAPSDVVIVNTCGFIEPAVEESLDAIGDALANHGRVIVTGCLGQRAEVIRRKYPEVLAITGPADYRAVMDAVHLAMPARSYDPRIDLVPAHGVKLTPAHYAYLKISEGCNHRCSFCIIPQLRGDLASRPIGDVMREAENLVAAGVRELLVISQDTSAYGVDLRFKLDFWGGRPVKTRFKELCESLATLGVWVRLHYVYPYPHVDEVVGLMGNDRLLPYLDIPFQHASPTVLRAMRRPAAAERVLERIERWRAVRPDIRIRSTFIVGFPGESDEDFDVLLEFLEEAKLDRAGCFEYSPIVGAPANALPDPVPDVIKRERYEQLMALQAQISEEQLARWVGTEQQVLVDDVDAGGAWARTQGDAPEVDGRVRIEGDVSSLKVGQWAMARIEGVLDEHDLYGTQVGR